MLLANSKTFFVAATSLHFFSPDAVLGFSFVPSRNALFVTNASGGERSTWRVPHISMAHVVSGDGESAGSNFRKTEESDTPIPFIDPESGSFIECYIDSVATVKGVDYSIGSPCDYSVALCFFDEDGQLNPVELDDEELMDEVFPIAEEIVEDEFGEELALMKTPQTLTLVGELELGGDEDDEYEFDEDEMGDEEEEVEILLSFEHDGKEFNLVRLLDPVLLVAKPDKDNPQSRLLLNVEESESVMPFLEEMMLDYQEEMDADS